MNPILRNYQRSELIASGVSPETADYIMDCRERHAVWLEQQRERTDTRRDEDMPLEPDEHPFDSYDRMYDQIGRTCGGVCRED